MNRRLFIGEHPYNIIYYLFIGNIMSEFEVWRYEINKIEKVRSKSYNTKMIKKKLYQKFL
jgi:hypothetical protein